jgi:hypothetical protein
MQLPALFRALTNRANIGGSSSNSNKGSTTPVAAATPLVSEPAGQYATTFESFEAPAPADPAAAFAAQQAAAGVALQQQPYLQSMMASAGLLNPTSGSSSSSSGAAYYTPTVAAAFAAHQQQANAAQQQQQVWQQPPQQQQQQQHAYGTWLSTPQLQASNMYPATNPAAAAAGSAAAMPVTLEASQIWSSSATGSIFNTQDDNSHNTLPGSSSSSSQYNTGSFSGSNGNMYNVPRIPVPVALAVQYIQAKPSAAVGSSYNLASLLSTMAGGYSAGSPPARLSSDQAHAAAAAAAAAAAVPDVMQAAGIVPKPRAATSRLSSGRRKML